MKRLDRVRRPEPGGRFFSSSKLLYSGLSWRVQAFPCERASERIAQPAGFL
jgi:hypothetical protein